MPVILDDAMALENALNWAVAASTAKTSVGSSTPKSSREVLWEWVATHAHACQWGKIPWSDVHLLTC
ncbi:hypothetical protein PAXRUDRAFT_240740 [Paxillus rubicundulus Ve08.2h10]|uniref:Unplaced genomic scaffold scaffold_1225, whole genome shotgun sequence n=1 Tax=Paxillus rubicundulus Ve08.2h10 TaxID=930991 RepID=A0A0D0CXL9_9AGAM|nr:hypothetical protein PAXRUDRAFT_240740 [Paxillus rubicundulus Ve08.2h10]